LKFKKKMLSAGLFRKVGPSQTRRSMSTTTKMHVFDTKVKSIQRDAASHLPDSKDYDYLRNHVSKILTERLDDIASRNFPIVLDLGSGYGNNLPNLQNKAGISTIYQLESSSGMLSRDIDLDLNFNIKPIRIIGTEEYLPFKEKSLDLVISNLSLHWVNDLPSTFLQVRKCLKDDGVFIGSMFGTDTLQELRSAFILAEQEREGGVSQHVSPFTGISDIGNLLSGSGFSLMTIDQDMLTIRYADAFVLMNDLRSMAENNAVILRRKFTSKETLFAMAAIYKELYGSEDGSIPASFNIIYFIGWAPHKSQPKPKPRGSHTHSFADLNKIGEKV